MVMRAAAFSRVCRRAFPAITNHPHSMLACSSGPSSDRLFSSHDNGEQLFSSSTMVNEEEEASHRKYYAISGTGQRSTVKMETNTGHNLQTDVPKKMGGGDSAPQPVEHLLAALLGCTQATAIYVGRTMNPRLIIDKIDFDVEAYRDERGALEIPIIDKLPTIPARLQCVSGTVRVHFKQKGVQVSEEQLRILGEQTEARCPIANMMHASGCVMDIQWVNGG
mmetsp:Transcript_21853/g.35759  ORF Transcript_21853/g.35759 Transcript_21853/m.35759 type:complete len:222 (-) Transcript_21853:64-729(-)